MRALFRIVIASVLILSPGNAPPATAQERAVCSDFGGRIQSRILGGRGIDPAEAPYQVTLSLPGTLCGGSLITPRHVLTAAHCVVSRHTGQLYAARAVTARLGADHRQGGAAHAVARIDVHPHYRPGSHHHDIAVLHLARPVDPRHGRPLPMQSARMDRLFGGPGSCAEVTGHGQLSHDGALPARLQAAPVPVRRHEACERAYGHRYDRRIMLCAGMPGRDSCLGDSGGPLVAAGGPTRRSQLGIVSFGEGCGVAGFPGVYTRVSAYRQWVLTIVTTGGS